VEDDFFSAGYVRYILWMLMSVFFLSLIFFFSGMGYVFIGCVGTESLIDMKMVIVFKRDLPVQLIGDRQMNGRVSFRSGQEGGFGWVQPTLFFFFFFAPS